MTGSEKPIAVTIGEPAGIGGELTLKAWLERQAQDLPPYFAIDDPERLERLAKRLGWTVPIVTVDTPDDAPRCFPDALPVLANAVPGSTTPGQPDPANADCVLASVRKAAEFVLMGSAAAIVTNPVHKKSLYDAGFQHPGHTEYLAELSGAERSVMMLVCPALRVVPVTGHIPLSEAIQALTTDEIVSVARLVERSLQRDFGIAQPHLMVAALNPHGGEENTLGREEREIIAPAVSALKQLGTSVSGPAPADTLFHERARDGYDAAICMHHDQALIPLKTVDFYRGVNVTLGLPFVRTSPDHGTAFEIAGMGVADNSSFVAALQMARDIAQCRQSHSPRGRKAFA